MKLQMQITIMGVIDSANCQLSKLIMAQVVLWMHGIVTTTTLVKITYCLLKNHFSEHIVSGLVQQHEEGWETFHQTSTAKVDS